MKRRKNTKLSGVLAVWVVVMCTMVGVTWAQVEARITTRPLTSQNIVDAGLPSDLQIANGTHVVGVGQPLYLDLLVESGITVTSVVWQVEGVRDNFNNAINNSVATFTPSPLGTNVLSYDGGDRDEFDIGARAVFVPDMAAAYDLSVTFGLSDGGSPLPSQVETRTVVGATFQGPGPQNVCTLCHSNKWGVFGTTKHSYAFKEQINGGGSDHFQAFCIRCHTTGYDDTPGAENMGFDDIAADEGWTFPTELSTNNWDDVPEELKKRANVTCEACHGPAGQHMYSLGSKDRIGNTLSAGSCGQCHDRATHHVKNSEWSVAGHSHGYVFRDNSSTCRKCHSGIGFINEYDPDYAGDGEYPNGTGNEGLSCATCHDPHVASGYPHQLRDLPTVTLQNGHVVTEGGAGKLCMHCHQSRYAAVDHVAGNWGRSLGPHHGPQGDMLVAQNAIEYGMDMPSSRHLEQVEDSCVGCHMMDLEGTDFEAAIGSAGGHTWKINWDNGTPTNLTDDVEVTAACQECHGDIDTFDFGGEDYDHDGVVEGVQTEIAGLMDQLGRLLPPLGDPDVALRDRSFTEQQNKAAWNWVFVEEDQSHGVHNPKYAAAILNAAIADLKGGIDVDRDGLLDAWEMTHFGNLTSQSGSDDADGDGLTNQQEQDLGTDPNEEDSDGDGFWDGIEVSGLSNPSDSNSVVRAGSVQMHEALEIGYLPQVTGTTVRFEVIDLFGNGNTWTNLGPAQTSTGEWIYQLDSIRNADNRFYRAIEE